MGLLGHGVCVCSALVDTAEEFSGVTVSMSPTAVYDECSLFHIIINTCKFSYAFQMSVWCMSLWFYFMFLWRLMTHWASFHMTTGCLDILFFLKYLLETLNHFSTGCLFLIDLQKFFTYSQYKFFVSYMHCQYLWPLWHAFSLSDVFWWTKVIYFNVVQVTYFFPVKLMPSVSWLRNANYCKAMKISCYILEVLLLHLSCVNLQFICNWFCEWYEPGAR